MSEICVQLSGGGGGGGWSGIKCKTRCDILQNFEIPLTALADFPKAPAVIPQDFKGPIPKATYVIWPEMYGFCENCEKLILDLLAYENLVDFWYLGSEKS